LVVIHNRVAVLRRQGDVNQIVLTTEIIIELKALPKSTVRAFVRPLVLKH
jgi:hypothetical protein